MNDMTRLYSFTVNTIINADRHDAYPDATVGKATEGVKRTVGKYILCKKELYRVDNITYLGLSKGPVLSDKEHYKLNFKIYCVLVPYNLNDSLDMEPNMYPHSQYLQGL